MPRKAVIPTPPPRHRVCLHCRATFVRQRNGQRKYCTKKCGENARAECARRGRILVGSTIIRTEDGRRVRIEVDDAGLPVPVEILDEWE